MIYYLQSSLYHFAPMGRLCLPPAGGEFAVKGKMAFQLDEKKGFGRKGGGDSKDEYGAR